MANGKILCLSSALLFLLSGHPQACAFQVTRQPKNKMQNSQLYQVKLNTDPQKSKSLQIEEAAGQKESEKTANMGSVSGQMAEIPAECKCYTDCPLLTNDPKVRDQLKKITETRPYPWFIAEKMATYLVDDIWSAPTRGHTSPTTFVNGAQQVKEKIVILGAGWGSAAVLRGIDTERYDVTIISPRNYFVFTPMLAGAAVGTVDVRSITQPIRAVSY